MKVIILILISMLFAFGQVAKDNMLFGTSSSPSNTYTITDADSIAESRVIWMERASSPDMLGALTIWGVKTLNSGTDREITPYIRLYHRLNDDTSYGPWHALSAISTGSSVRYEYEIPGESWWTYCKGYEIEFRTSGSAAVDIDLIGYGDHR